MISGNYSIDNSLGLLVRTLRMSVGSMISDVSTPCFLVDLEIVKKNAAAMLETCKSMGLSLRHMTKTHKTRYT